MGSDKSQIAGTVKSYIMQEFLPDDDPEVLDDDTPLISGGILDSIATVKLVTHLEKLYGVRFQPHEMSVDHLDTLSDIGDLVEAKMAAKG